MVHGFHLSVPPDAHQTWPGQDLGMHAARGRRMVAYQINWIHHIVSGLIRVVNAFHVSVPLDSHRTWPGQDLRMHATNGCCLGCWANGLASSHRFGIGTRGSRLPSQRHACHFLAVPKFSEEQAGRFPHIRKNGIEVSTFPKEQACRYPHFRKSTPADFRIPEKQACRFSHLFEKAKRLSHL